MVSWSASAQAVLAVLVDPFWGVMGGVAAGLAYGIPAAYTWRDNCSQPCDWKFGFKDRWSAIATCGIVFGVCGGAIGLLVWGPDPRIGLGVLIAVPIAAAYGLNKPDATVRAASPAQLLKQDTRNARFFGITYALSVGAVVGVILGSRYGLGNGLAMGVLVGVIAGLSGGLINGPVWILAQDDRGQQQTGAIAWLQLLVMRLWRVDGKKALPWDLMSFLQEAHERGVLRQVGPVYQFRHEHLREALQGLR